MTTTAAATTTVAGTGRRRRPPRRTPVAVAGWCLTVAGTGHLVLAVVGLLQPAPVGERAARALMASTVADLGGVDRSLWQLFVGFSLATGILLAALGGLTLLVVRRAPALVDGTRAVPVLLLGATLAAFVTALVLLPPPPIVLLGVASATLATALVRPGHDTAVAPGPRG